MYKRIVLKWNRVRKYMSVNTAKSKVLRFSKSGRLTGQSLETE